MHIIRRDPRLFGEARSRWTLAAVQRAVAWMDRFRSRSGVWRVLARLGVHWKRGHDHLVSPDPAYTAKLTYLQTIRAVVEHDPDRQLLLFQDEMTYYRQPSLAHGYERVGAPGPRAERSYRANTPTRVAAALNVVTGQVTALQGSHIGIAELVRLYEAICATYPGVRRLYVAQDNWPVHFHPDLLAALEPQESPFPFPHPPDWPTEPRAAARTRWGDRHLPIQLVPLPTYASWTNPVEKLWRWLRQDVLHLHHLADDLPALRQHVLAFLAQFAAGSPALLRYVGLLVPT